MKLEFKSRDIKNGVASDLYVNGLLAVLCVNSGDKEHIQDAISS